MALLFFVMMCHVSLRLTSEECRRESDRMCEPCDQPAALSDQASQDTRHFMVSKCQLQEEELTRTKKVGHYPSVSLELYQL